MQNTQKIEWPPFSITKYMVRVLNALESKERTAEELSNISGYSGGAYQIERSLLQKLQGEDLLTCSGHLYSITEKGDQVLSAVMDYRDIEVLDARNLKGEEKDSLLDGSEYSMT